MRKSVSEFSIRRAQRQPENSVRGASGSERVRQEELEAPRIVASSSVSAVVHAGLAEARGGKWSGTGVLRRDFRSPMRKHLADTARVVVPRAAAISAVL
jgi:hypothetical protein